MPTTAPAMRVGLCLTVFGALFGYLLAAGGWITAVVGYGLLINVEGLSAVNVTGLTHYPNWAFAVGTPFVLIAIGMQIIVLATRTHHKAWWCLFAMPLAFLLAYLFAAAGAVLYSSSESIHRIIQSDGAATIADVYTVVQFTGTLAVVVFSICTLGCIFAATPYAFDTGGNTRVATTASTDNHSTTRAGLPKVGWTRERDECTDGHTPLNTALPEKERSEGGKGEKGEDEVGERENDTQLMQCQVQTVTTSSWIIGSSDVEEDPDGVTRGKEDHEETKC